MNGWLLTTCSLVLGVCQAPAPDAIDRLRPARLEAVREATAARQGTQRKVGLQSGFTDYRALLHLHSHLSHDSRGTIEDILAAAKRARAQILMFSEHPAEHYDFFGDGHHGLKDGVLLVPGAETGGFLAYPTRSIRGQKPDSPQAFCDLVRQHDGLVFLSHIEERMDWQIAGLTGMEIYNTHADFKDERRFHAALANPLALFALLPAMKQYPQETIASLQHYPETYLRRWDELCSGSRLTGIAANDSHQNTAIVLRMTETGKVALEDALGKKLAVLDPDKIGFLKQLVVDKKPGEVLLEQYLDRYENSFRHVSTHLWMTELSRDQVWDALKSSRAYVAFDWMADPTGFVFRAESDAEQWPMGSEVAMRGGLRLLAEAPQEGSIKLVRNGSTVKEAAGAVMDFIVQEPGNYRVEVWLDIAGEQRPWILSNPIYIRDAI